jgi:murein DD-endopeptidase MepM/ murein hydrolase activator NlpD
MNFFTHRPIVAFALLSLCVLFNARAAQAQNGIIDELRQNISARENDIKMLEAEIAAYQKELNVLSGEKSSLQDAIKTIDLTRAKLGKDIELTTKKIAQAQSAVDQLSRQIGFKEGQIDRSQKAIARIIREIDQTSRHTLLEAVLARERISEFFQDVDDLSRLQSSISDHIAALKKFREDLEIDKAAIETEKKNLTALRSRLADQKILADQQRREHDSLLSETKRQESNYTKLLNERIAKKKQFEREIEDFEAQLKAVIDPNSYPPPGSRVLAFPVDQPFVTQKFGRTVDARRLYSSGTHNGIDFRASRGTPVKAAADGIVVATGDTDQICRWASYGKWVLVRHQNGLSTLYAHLDLIKVKEGDGVSTGSLIGYSGFTGYATGPHLHFTVLVSSAVEIGKLPSKSCKGATFTIPVAPQNAYLDPEAYL